MSEGTMTRSNRPLYMGCVFYQLSYRGAQLIYKCNNILFILNTLLFRSVRAS